LYFFCIWLEKYADTLASIQYLQDKFQKSKKISGKTKSHSRHPSLNFVSSKSTDSSSSQAAPATSAEDTAALKIGEIAEDVLAAKLSPSVEVAAPAGNVPELGGSRVGAGAAETGAQVEDKRSASGLLANLDLSLAEIKLSDSPKKKKITKVHNVVFFSSY
jgi:hypothetical protein